MLHEEQDCDRNQDYRADDCEKEVSLFAQGCTMFTTDLLLLKRLNVLVKSDDVVAASCCFTLCTEGWLCV